MSIKYVAVKNVTYSDTTAVKVGTVPANSIVTAIRVHVATAFNGADTDYIQIGTSADADAYAANTDVASIGDATVTREDASFGVLDSTGSSDVYATFENGGSAATAGSAYVVLEIVQL